MAILIGDAVTPCPSLAGCLHHQQGLKQPLLSPSLGRLTFLGQPVICPTDLEKKRGRCQRELVLNLFNAGEVVVFDGGSFSHAEP